MKMYCAVCGKPPDEPVSCPNCHIENICSYHVYSFVIDDPKSPRGCAKCAPRCTICNAQTPLQLFLGKAVCMSCRHILQSAEQVRKERMNSFAENLKMVLTTLLTIAGLGVGIYFGFQPEYQQIVFDVTKTEMPIILLVPIWAMIGLIVGSLSSVVLNALIPTRDD
jgi:hypothetical protein